jgi:hypothetical protein
MEGSMSKLIKLLSFAVILFSAAAGGSWYLQFQKQQADAKDTSPEGAKAAHGSASHGGTAHAKAEPPAKVSAHKTPEAEQPPRPLPRPATSTDTDRITQMAASLQQQQVTLKKREDFLQNREKQIEIVHQEVLKEQKKLDGVRKEIQAELQLVAEKLDLAEKRLAEGDKQKQKIEVQKEDVQNAVLQISSVETKNIKQLATIYDKMETEAASQSIQQMVDQGKLDMAVSILSHMRDRQAAGLLGDIAKQDPDIAVRLFDRMRVVKTPAAGATKGKE